MHWYQTDQHLFSSKAGPRAFSPAPSDHVRGRVETGLEEGPLQKGHLDLGTDSIPIRPGKEKEK